MIWEYFSSAKEKEAKEAVSKAKKKAEQQELAEALEVGGWVLPVIVFLFLLMFLFLFLCLYTRARRRVCALTSGLD